MKVRIQYSSLRRNFDHKSFQFIEDKVEKLNQVFIFTDLNLIP